MDRRVEIRRKLLARLAELDEEIPQRAAALEEQAAQLRFKVAERRRTIRELDELDERKRHLRVIDGGKKASAILVPILLLRGLPRQRVVLAAASTVAVGATAVVFAVAVTSPVHKSTSVSRPAVTLPVPVATSPPGWPAPVASTVPPRPSVGPSSAPVTPVAPSAATPGPVPHVVPPADVTVALTAALRSTVSVPPLLPTLPVPLSTPSLPVTLPSLTLPTLPVPTGSCLVHLDLQPVAGACVL